MTDAHSMTSPIPEVIKIKNVKTYIKTSIRLKAISIIFCIVWVMFVLYNDFNENISHR